MVSAMRFHRRRIVVALASAVTFAAIAAPAEAEGSVVPTPNVSRGNNVLLGVSTRSPADVWAVGHSADQPPYLTHPLAEHWDGRSWRVVATPRPMSDPAKLEAVSARTAGDVWAVGTVNDPAPLGESTLIEHWDGTRWLVVASPDPGGRDFPDRLHAVDAITADDAWAVGLYWQRNGSSYRYRSLIAHWDGSTWRAVPNPGTTELFGVSAVTRDDVWAVGTNQRLHWDGRRWTVVPPPAAQLPTVVLRSVSAVSSRLVWAVGFVAFSCGEGQVCGRPVIERYDGTGWSVVPIPDGGQGGLQGVVGVSAGRAWAVGNGGDRGGTLVLRWDGRTWREVASPHDEEGSLWSVDATSAVAWAVGDRYSELTGTARTLAVRFV
jgi:hypothetical protein